MAKRGRHGTMRAHWAQRPHARGAGSRCAVRQGEGCPVPGGHQRGRYCRATGCAGVANFASTARSHSLFVRATAGGRCPSPTILCACRPAARRVPRPDVHSNGPHRGAAPPTRAGDTTGFATSPAAPTEGWEILTGSCPGRTAMWNIPTLRTKFNRALPQRATLCNIFRRTHRPRAFQWPRVT